jgi:hypothetical protein
MAVTMGIDDDMVVYNEHYYFYAKSAIHDGSVNLVRRQFSDLQHFVLLYYFVLLSEYYFVLSKYYFIYSKWFFFLCFISQRNHW